MAVVVLNENPPAAIAGDSELADEGPNPLVFRGVVIVREPRQLIRDALLHYGKNKRPTLHLQTAPAVRRDRRVGLKMKSPKSHIPGGRHRCAKILPNTDRKSTGRMA